MDAYAATLEAQLGGGVVTDLQVFGRLLPSPTPPALDVYPATPFQEPATYGPGRKALFFIVRARVNTPDIEGAQDTLLAMMDPSSAQSVEQALLADRTLGGVVQRLSLVEGPSEFGVFVDPDPRGGLAYLGCTWRTLVYV